MMLEYTRKHNQDPYLYTVSETESELAIGQILYVDDGTYLTRTERSLREVAAATQTFASFSGLGINTGKSWACELSFNHKGEVEERELQPIETKEWVASDPEHDNASVPEREEFRPRREELRSGSVEICSEGLPDRSCSGRCRCIGRNKYCRVRASRDCSSSSFFGRNSMAEVKSTFAH